MVQWLKIHLPVQGMQVQSLVGELRSHMPQRYWAHTRHLESMYSLKPVLRDKTSSALHTRTHHNKDSAQPEKNKTKHFIVSMSLNNYLKAWLFPLISVLAQLCFSESSNSRQTSLLWLNPTSGQFKAEMGWQKMECSRNGEGDVSLVEKLSMERFL